MPRSSPLAFAALLVTLAAAGEALAADEPAPGADTVKTVEVVEHEHEQTEEPKTTWFGLSFGTVATPLSPGGHISSSRRVTSNPFRACLEPAGERYCSAMRGFDVRVQMYSTRGAWEYPRWVGYFRTGYQAGHGKFDAASTEGYAPGEATSLSYQAVPLFFGGSVYAFKKFPIRPYAGMGAGFDIVRLRYGRNESRALLDASARIGFELHAGLEARISNVVALSAEVTQLWSARRKLAGVPDFSNEGLTVMAGIAVSIPTRKDLRRRHHHVHRRTTVTTERPTPRPTVVPSPQVIVAPAAAPVIVAPAAAPVIVAPAPAPVIVAPEPAAVIVAPALAPAPVLIAPTPA